MTSRATIAGIAGILVCAVSWSLPAAASTTFPAQVDRHLMLTGDLTVEKIAPPDGCLMCHMTEAGGFGSNNGFGAELRQHGAVGAEPATVGPALDALEAVDPHAIGDITMGIDPNDDHSTPTVALPQPSYGCAVASASGGRERTDVDGWLASFALALALALAARRRSSQESQ